MVSKHPVGLQCCSQSPRSEYCFLELNYLALSKISFIFLKIEYALRKKQKAEIFCIRELLMRLSSNYTSIYTIM